MNAARTGRLVATLVTTLGMGIMFYAYLAVIVYAFMNWGALWGVIALLFPPADLLMVWFASPELGWWSVFGLILTFAGGAAYPED